VAVGGTGVIAAVGVAVLLKGGPPGVKLGWHAASNNSSPSAQSPNLMYCRMIVS
jgi:hypothetical protein